MRVTIVGGTGLLGSVIARTLVQAGHRVRLIARRPTAVEVPDHAGTALVLLDVDTASDAALADALSDTDWLVYALGPDDRDHIRPPAAAFFDERLVRRTERIHRIAADAGVQASVVLGSYFAERGRNRPDFLAHHPYVAARVAQADAAVAAGAEGGMRVTLLEIPYVFATRPGLVPLWKTMYYDTYRWLPVLPLPDGGTTMVTGETVAEATLAALEVGVHGRSYPVGDDDLTWREFLSVALRPLRGRVLSVNAPRWMMEPVAWGMKAKLAIRGNTMGLDTRWVMRDVMLQKIYNDHESTRRELGIERRDVRAAIEENVRFSYPHRFRG